MPEQFGSLIAFAASAPLLLLLLYVFRSIPWTTAGPWRSVIALAAVAAVMFMIAEAVLIAQADLAGLDALHQEHRVIARPAVKKVMADEGITLD